MRLVHHNYNYSGVPPRYYIDGKRVTKQAYESAKFGRVLSCFQTYRRNTWHWVHSCYASARKES